MTVSTPESEADRRAGELRNQINRYNRLYHTLDSPEITDAEYDALIQELVKLETEHPEVRDPNSPTQRVGAALAGYLPAVDHPEPMLSIQSGVTLADLHGWVERTMNRIAPPGTRDLIPMMVEPKIDGLAIRLVYEHGEFRQAVTRGNGTSGEDVTHNVRTIHNLPLTLVPADAGTEIPETLHAIGEIYMPRSAFHEANLERAEQGETPFANPRNAAAGTIWQLDPHLASDRGLRAWVYGIAGGAGTGGNPAHSHRSILDRLQALGFPVNPLNRLCRTVPDIEAFHRELAELRDQLSYEIDGIVIKADGLDLRRRLGATNREPRWAFALKFTSDAAVTLLREIRLSHGRFGRLTPVAVLDPVEVGGVTIQSATLHNLEDLDRKDIRPGTRVIVERAGDVIPQVTGPADPEQNRRARTFRMPAECPACGGQVRTQGNGSAHWCINPDCPALLPEQLISLVGKHAMDIEGLGERWCRELVEKGMVQNTADVYNLTREQLLELDRMGEKLAGRILHNIEASRSRPLERTLYALGIYRLGRHVSRILAERFGHIDQIIMLEREELARINGIGPSIAASVHRGMRSARVTRTIEIMKQAGVNMTGHKEEEKDMSEDVNNGVSSALAGKKIVVTGKLAGMTRFEAESIIRQHGGEPMGSVTRSTDYLVVGEKPGSKLSKAQQFGVKVLELSEFNQLLAA